MNHPLSDPLIMTNNVGPSPAAVVCRAKPNQQYFVGPSPTTAVCRARPNNYSTFHIYIDGQAFDLASFDASKEPKNSVRSGYSGKPIVSYRAANLSLRRAGCVDFEETCQSMDQP